MHQFMNSRRLVLAGATTGVIVLAACSGDATGVSGSSGNMLRFTAGGAASANAASFAVAPITGGKDTLNLTSIVVTIARAELKRVPSDSCAGDRDSDEDDDHPANTPSTAACGELKIGPTTVALPLDGTPVVVPANTIAAGNYRALQLRVSKIEVVGTFDGKAFDDTIPVHVTSRVDFSPPLVVVQGKTVSLTVNVPANKWFVNQDGSLVNPLMLKTQPTLLERLRARIDASFRASDDDDGHEGHNEHENEGG